MKKFINKVKGFTLVELAIVIAVIAILIAVLVPTFIALIDKANESKDTQMIYNVNNALAIESATTTIETPAQALDVAEKAGYSIEKLTPTSDSEIYYDQENVRFIIVYSDGTRYPTSAEDTDLNSPTIWRFVDEATYQSILAQDTSSATVQSSKTAAKTAVKAEDVATATVTHTVSYIAKGEWTTSFDYTGMGGVDTTRATGITQVNYTIQIVENTTYLINPIYSVSDEVKEVAVVSAVEGKISVKKSCGQNTYTTAKAAEGVTCSLTFEVADDSSPILYDTSPESTITVIVIQNGEDVTEDVTESIDLAKSADFSTGVLELGTSKYPYLINNADKLSKLANGGYCQLTADIEDASAITIASGKEVTLDLNGHILTCDNSLAASTTRGTTTYNYYSDIINNGKLTVVDSIGSGKIQNTAVGSYASYTYTYYSVIYNNGTLIVDGGALNTTGKYAYGIYNVSELTINGGSISTSGQYANAVYTEGTITINGGSISTSGTSSNGINLLGNTAEINGGNISAKQYAIYSYNGAVLDINGGSFTASGFYVVYITGTGCSTTITGGNINGGTLSAVYDAGNNTSGNNLTITGGTISSTGTYGGVYFINGTLNISGGSICGKNYAVYMKGNANATGPYANVTITGGDYSVTVDKKVFYCYNYVNITIDKVDSCIEDAILFLLVHSYNNTIATISNSVDITVTGTTEDNNNSGYAIISEAKEKTTVYSLGVNSESSHACIIDSQGSILSYYANVYAALNATKDGDTVKLLKDNTYFTPDSLSAIQNKKITLDLNGYTIKKSGTILTVGTGGILDIISSSNTVGTIQCTSTGNSAFAIEVQPGGTVYVRSNITLTSSSLATVFIGESSASDPNSTVATLNVYGSIINTKSAGGYAISGNGNDKTGGTKINIYDGAVVTSEYATAIYHPQTGTITVSGGTITGYYAGLQLCAGTAVISGGTFTSTIASPYISSNNVYQKTGDGTIADGAAISIINRSGYGTYSSTGCSVTSVSISGGTFISESGFEAIQYYTYVGDNSVSALSDDQTIVSITGGEFSSSLTGNYSAYCIADEYSVSTSVNSNGYYEVTKDEAAG